MHSSQLNISKKSAYLNAISFKFSYFSLSFSGLNVATKYKVLFIVSALISFAFFLSKIGFTTLFSINFITKFSSTKNGYSYLTPSINKSKVGNDVIEYLVINSSFKLQFTLPNKRFVPSSLYFFAILIKGSMKN